MWSTLPRPIICLAPMAGYTDSSFRQLIKEICPRAICFTEFTSVDGILHGNAATLRQIAFNPKTERPIVAQIFGKKPANFLQAARVLTELGVDAIDINMGCPAKKVISSDCGSSLLKNIALAAEIVAATVQATHLPVSVKMRAGTTCYDEDYFFRFAKAMEDAGARLITVHGRTSKQMYGGMADWRPIYALKKLLKIPVIGNGDIESAADAREKLGTLDGIMIGRGTFGNPWLLAEIAAAFENQTFAPLSFAEKIPLIERHIDLSCGLKGPVYGIIEMRKHFAWYVRGLRSASLYRQQLIKSSTRQEALDIFHVIKVQGYAEKQIFVAKFCHFVRPRWAG